MQFHSDDIETHTTFEREIFFADTWADELQRRADALQKAGKLSQIEAEKAALLWWAGEGEL